jgi:hypothetical protein
MKRIILFRFDRDPLVCRSRVALLRRLNPGVAIHGLYGGPHGLKRVGFRIPGKHLLHLDSVYCSPRSGRENWNQVDPLLAAWYRDLGCRLDFDVAYLVEWDLLFLDSLERVYASVPDGAIGLTALTPTPAIENEWPWLQRPADRREWEDLLSLARAAWNYDDVPHACLGGGPCFPRSFLADIATITIPQLSTEELRLPLFAQIFGYSMVDTGLRRGLLENADDDRFFNVGGTEIEPSTIMSELAKPDGRRAFHPVRRLNGISGRDSRASG